MSTTDAVISADSHVVEPFDLWSKALGDRFGERIPHEISEHEGEKGRFFFTGRQVTRIGAVDDSHAEFREAGYLPERRVAFQEEAGVSAEILYGSYMLLILQSPYRDALRAACEVYNDWLADFVSYAPQRLIGTGMVPLDDPEWAEAEIRRIVDKGLRGICINVALPENVPPYRDSRYDRIWATLQDLNIPLTLHSITGQIIDPFYPRTQREKEEGAALLLALGMEAQPILANDLIFGRILDRFPGLKVVLSEFETSWVPYFCWKMDQMPTTLARKLDLPKLEMAPSDYFRSRIWTGVIGDPFASHTLSYLGPERILWGSDFPHVRSVGVDTEGKLSRMFADLSPEDRRGVVGKNVAAIYGF